MIVAAHQKRRFWDVGTLGPTGAVHGSTGMWVGVIDQPVCDGYILYYVMLYCMYMYIPLSLSVEVSSTA